MKQCALFSAGLLTLAPAAQLLAWMPARPWANEAPRPLFMPLASALELG